LFTTLVLTHKDTIRDASVFLNKTGFVRFSLNRMVWGTRESYKQAGKREGDRTSLPKRRRVLGPESSKEWVVDLFIRIRVTVTVTVTVNSSLQ